jgi:hypothetical protein
MKYSVTFFILGGLVSYLPITLGEWWHVLHWFSLSCFALSAGYAGLGARILGKRPDGCIPVWARFIHLPFLLYSGTVWQISCFLSRENPWDKVSDDLILGRRLRTKELPCGIVNYVDLTFEFEDPKTIRESKHYINLPILDAGVPMPDALHLAISKLKPGVTFVHCAQGHGRTGIFALALLYELGRIQSFDEGMAFIKNVRPGIGLNKTQERFIKKYLATQWS